MNPWRSLGGMPREVWSVIGATLINRSGTMVLPYLALYITRGLGFSETDAGLALLAYGVGALITSPISGRLVDQIGAREILVGSLLLSGMLLLALSVFQNYWIVLGGMFAWAVISEAFRPASLAILTEVVAPELRKPAFVLSRMAVNIGMSIGPAVGGFLVVWSYKALFTVDAVTALVAGAVLLVSLWRYRRRDDGEGDRSRTADPDAKVAENQSARRNIGGAFTDRRLLYFLIATLPVLVVFYQSGATTSIYVVQHLGMPESAYGLLIMINTLMIIFLELPLNQAIAEWSHRRTLVTGAFLIAAGMGGLALARGFWGAATTFVVMTFGEMIFIPASSDYIAKIAPTKSKGDYLGLYTMSFNVAFLIAAVAGTQILQWLGPMVLWLSAFGFGLLSTAMLLRVSNGNATLPQRA